MNLNSTVVLPMARRKLSLNAGSISRKEQQFIVNTVTIAVKQN